MPPNAPSEDRSLHDAFVEEHVERALAPYREVMPPEVLSAFADELRIFFLTHPVAERMLSRIRPRGVIAASDDVKKPGRPGEAAMLSKKGKVGTGDPR
jgi:hypothetical protein